MRWKTHILYVCPVDSVHSLSTWAGACGRKQSVSTYVSSRVSPLKLENEIQDPQHHLRHTLHLEALVPSIYHINRPHIVVCDKRGAIQIPGAADSKCVIRVGQEAVSGYIRCVIWLNGVWYDDTVYDMMIRCMIWWYGIVIWTTNRKGDVIWDRGWLDMIQDEWLLYAVDASWSW